MSLRGKLYSKKLFEQIYDPPVTFYIVVVIFMAVLHFGGIWISGSLLGLKEPYPFYIGGLLLLAPLFGLCFLISYYGENGDKIIRIIEHPLFGLVNQRRVYWDASFSMEGTVEKVVVISYDGPDVTENQTETFLWLRDNWDWIRKKIIGDLERFKDIPSQPSGAIFTEFSLDDSEPRTIAIRLQIDDPSDPDWPWEYWANFENGNFAGVQEESFG